MRRTIRAVHNQLNWRASSSVVLVALALVCFAPRATAQSGEDPYGTQGKSFRPPAPGSSAQAPSSSDLERIKERFAEQDRDKLFRDMQKLSALSQKLQNAMQSSDTDAVSPDVHQISKRLEKLARRIREELAGI